MNRFIPAILALYASPTPHKLLLAAPAITPAHLLPCLFEKGKGKRRSGQGHLTMAASFFLIH